VDLRPRTDGGVVMRLNTFSKGAQASNLLELSPDGTIHRHYVDAAWPLSNAILPDGSLIVEHNVQLVRLIPPA
jgi:hypothetical protein